jgi:hypothetical protein
MPWPKPNEQFYLNLVLGHERHPQRTVKAGTSRS